MKFKNGFLRIVFFGGLLSILGMGLVSVSSHKVYAAASGPDFSWIDISGPEGNTTGFTNLQDLLAGAVNVMLGIAMSASIIAIISSGTKYITAKGDFKAAAEAKTSLTYSIVALLLTFAAFTILKVIVNTLGGSSAVGKIWLVQ